MTNSTTVVLVDDSPSVRATVSFVLEREGFEVHTAVNGREALGVIGAVRPRAVLLDAMMPEIDGFEVCRRLRANPELADTLVIMVTAMGQRIDEENARDAGVDHFLTKPFDLDRVLELLEEQTRE